MKIHSFSEIIKRTKCLYKEYKMTCYEPHFKLEIFLLNRLTSTSHKESNPLCLPPKLLQRHGRITSQHCRNSSPRFNCSACSIRMRMARLSQYQSLHRCDENPAAAFQTELMRRRKELWGYWENLIKRYFTSLDRSCGEFFFSVLRFVPPTSRVSQGKSYMHWGCK